MLLTEDEARQKWCPFSRGVTATASIPAEICNSTSFNRFGIEGEDPQTPRLPQVCFCIASGCMQWRWAIWFPAEETDPYRKVRYVEDWQSAIVFAANEYGKNGIVKGFCGLAGKPE